MPSRGGLLNCVTAVFAFPGGLFSLVDDSRTGYPPRALFCADDTAQWLTGVEFDVDIQQLHPYWCCPKWRGSLHCSPMPVVEPRECSERAYAYYHGRATQPRIKIDILIEPPKQHSAPNAEPDGASGEIAEAQMGDRFEPRYYCETKADPIERHDDQDYRRYETHCG
jgi:hypothetical protein